MTDRYGGADAWELHCLERDEWMEGQRGKRCRDCVSYDPPDWAKDTSWCKPNDYYVQGWWGVYERECWMFEEAEI